MKLWICAAAALALAASAAGAVVGPEQGYRHAYRLVREAKMADYRGNAELAASKWDEARRLLQKISRDFPDWNRKIVLSQLGEVTRSLRTAPVADLGSFEMMIVEMRGVAEDLAELDGRKVALATQMEWEKKKLKEIEGSARDFNRIEHARRILELDRDAPVTLADIRRAEDGRSASASELAAWPFESEEWDETLGLDIDDLSGLEGLDLEVDLNDLDALAPESADLSGVIEEQALELDTDDDGLLDLEELELGTDLNDPDSDNDGLLDGQEVNDHDTDPIDPDTDGDNWDDGDEVELGYDPNDPNDPGFEEE